MLPPYEYTPSKRLSHQLWDLFTTGSSICSDCLVKSSVSLTAFAAIHLFSDIYSKTFLVKSLGITLGTLTRRSWHRFNFDRFLALPTWEKKLSVRVHIIALSMLIETAVTFFNPIAGKTLALFDGFLEGLCTKSQFALEQQSTKNGQTDMMDIVPD